MHKSNSISNTESKISTRNRKMVNYSEDLHDNDFDCEVAPPSDLPSTPLPFPPQEDKGKVDQSGLTRNLQMSRIEESLKKQMMQYIEEKIRKELYQKFDKLNEKYEKRAKDMETRFNHRMEEKTKEINNLAATLEDYKKKNDQLTTQLETLNAKIETSTERNNNLQSELQQIRNETVLQKKKEEAEVLSRNLLLTGPEVPLPTPDENLSNITIDLIRRTTRYPLNENQIASTKRFGKKPEGGKQDKRGILVKFHTKETKVEIVKNNIYTRTSGFYVNELLTREVNELFWEVRNLKKQHPDLIKILHTNNGIIKAKKTSVGKGYEIFTEQDLKKFKNDIGLVA